VQLADGLALVFDMDGVLVHSNPVHEQAWKLFNRRYGMETTDEMMEAMYGKRNDEIIRLFFGDLEAEEITARGAAKEQLYREMSAGDIEKMLVPGLRSFLERHRTAPMALASNAEPANVNFILDEAGLRPYFRAVVNGHQVERPKPAPEIYLRVAELLGVSPANCLIFEDSYSGVRAAMAVGARVIGVRTTHEDLPGTDLTIDNFWNRDLEPWVLAQKRVDCSS
jgi:beta-phosphoglucomutase family hydrolase